MEVFGVPAMDSPPSCLALYRPALRCRVSQLLVFEMPAAPAAPGAAAQKSSRKLSRLWLPGQRARRRSMLTAGTARWPRLG